jgi:phosphoribosylamine---glycine ligase
MNVLVVGSGGREHALAWKLGQSPRADRVFVAAGNAGTAEDAENVDISENDFPALVSFAKQNDVGLTVVGPEVPLTNGLVDVFKSERLKAFGPTKSAAILEGSKVYCKNLLQKARIPSASYQVFTDPHDALDYLDDSNNAPFVVKADGLAAGKGVIVCDKIKMAMDAVRNIMRDRAFGDAGNSIVIEERLHGQEVSVLAITDGQTIMPLQPAQDHKPAYDDDKGPNTGGMGAYCPAPLVDEEQLAWINEKVLFPTVHAMKRDGRSFRGVLYAGLMMTDMGPRVLEYNVRFGDPECQPLLMRLKTDLLDILEATVDGRLAEIGPAEWDPRPSVCVVMASKGYPAEYKKGFEITGLDDAAKLPDVKVFHAGTAVKNGKVVNNGGRVLGVTAQGDTISQAKLNAYRAVKCIRWEGAWCRKDISDKAIG